MNERRFLTFLPAGPVSPKTEYSSREDQKKDTKKEEHEKGDESIGGEVGGEKCVWKRQ
jgi:hypothetical protein